MMSKQKLNINQTLTRAKSLSQKGELKKAKDLYRRILALYPKNTRAQKALVELQQQTSPKDEDSPTQNELQYLLSLYQDVKYSQALVEAQKLRLKHPNSADVHNIIGAIYINLGNNRDALEAYRIALNLSPDMFVAHNNIGVALKNSGQLESAVDSFDQALKIKPDYAEAHNNLANTYKDLGKQDQAFTEYKKALKINPNYPEALYNLGLIFYEKKDYKNALDHFTQATNLKPDYAEAHNNLGNTFNRLNNTDDALKHYKIAETISPSNVETLHNIGAIHENYGNTDKAISYFQAAIAISTDYTPSQINLSHIYQSLGKNEAAIALYENILAKRPDHALTLYNLHTLKTYTPDDPQIEKMKSLASSPDLKAEDVERLNFALAKAYDDIGDLRTGFKHLLAGNMLRKKLSGYNISNDRKLFDRIKIMSTELLKHLPTQNTTKTEQHPIFIVGMPRSGTTLLEQILASHSQISGAGELETMTTLSEPIINHDFRANNINQQLPFLIQSMRESYLLELQKLHLGSPVVTDKMPLNFRWIGFILHAFPEAKIIHIERDPMATCWSIFRRLFSSQGNGFAYNMEDLAAFYFLYKDLMSFWKKMFPEKVYTVNYEQLTLHQETETRKILAHCKLNWEEECLSFYNTERLVKTASSSQVRKEMYTGSSTDWKRYESYLKPLENALNI